MMKRKNRNLVKDRFKQILQSVKKDKAAWKEVRLGNPVRSVGAKMFLSLFLSVVVFVLAVGLTSYWISADIVQNKVAESSHQTIIQAAGKIDLMFQNLEEITMQMLLDENMKNLIVRLDDPSIPELEKIDLRNALTKEMQTYSFSNGALSAIHIASIKGNKLYSTTSEYDIDKIKEKDWYDSVLQANGKLVWLPAKVKGQLNNGVPTFGMARVMKTVNGAELAVLIIEVKVEALGGHLESVRLAETSELRIIDREGVTMFSSVDGELEQNIPVSLSTNESGERLSSSREIVDGPDGARLLAVYHQLSRSNWTLVGTMPVGELVKDARSIWHLTLIVAGAAAVLALLIAYVMTRTISKPLADLRRLMSEGEKGNLAVRTNFKRKDEFGQLGISFDRMMDQITKLVQSANQSVEAVLSTSSELSDASKKTAASAREIAIASEEIANGASSLAVEAEKGNDLTLSISQQMKQVIDANVEMGSSASEVEQVSVRGATYMSELIEKTGMTEEMTRSMVEKVDRLKESTRSIRKILDVLNNVAKQTNILSLNATIEAARAGTAGKGFMVVADEIRKLADQSRESISVVGEITEKIQNEIDETVAVLSQAYPIFQEQIASVKEASLIFSTVQTRMGEFISRLDQVTESIQQLDQTQAVLSEAMGNVSAVAEESSATSEEVASLCTEQLNIGEGLVELSDKLESVSNQLKESLSRFTL
jgi:methyl-accepting chemotaxis protein